MNFMDTTLCFLGKKLCEETSIIRSQNHGIIKVGKDLQAPLNDIKFLFENILSYIIIIKLCFPFPWKFRESSGSTALLEVKAGGWSQGKSWLNPALWIPIRIFGFISFFLTYSTQIFNLIRVFFNEFQTIFSLQCLFQWLFFRRFIQINLIWEVSIQISGSKPALLFLEYLIRLLLVMGVIPSQVNSWVWIPGWMSCGWNCVHLPGSKSWDLALLFPAWIPPPPPFFLELQQVLTLKDWEARGGISLLENKGINVFQTWFSWISLGNGAEFQWLGIFLVLEGAYSQREYH